MRLLSLKELEERTGIKARTWRYYVHIGKLAAVRGPNKKILVSEEELKRFIESLPKIGRKEV
ncbi:helix-turn-helix domain-containing protein [Caldanaerobacter subterraneus KAk]|uniref:helix-turn-helix domain-containing protein n=1 Tax=Caldanaerobacter subterraneus TaxID=911092 RepID=UPI0032C022D0